MKIRLFAVLALTLLAVSACVVEPIGGGGGGYYRGGGGWGGHEGHGGGRGGDHDEGRRVWR